MKKITLMVVLLLGATTFAQSIVVEAESFNRTGGNYNNDTFSFLPDGDPEIDGPSTGVKRQAAIFDFTNGNDWVEFDITVATEGSYTASFLYGSPDSPDGEASADIMIDGTMVGNHELTSTGDWGTFVTNETAFEFELTAGSHVLRLQMPEAPVWQYNLDKITLTRQGALSVDKFTKSELSNYSYDSVTDTIALSESVVYSVYSIAGQEVASGEDDTISLASLANGIYILATDKGTAKVVKH